ncbi:MAG: ABC transporter ATP-binding protein [Deltaproteobacteria bacterium]|nr:ABC transporter ATP-binding protein [Deltaproteobacteria bacterium]
MENTSIAPLLDVRNLATWFYMPKNLFSRKNDPIRAVDRVSFFINQKETLGLVGESGCGKTTLGRTILGLETPVDGEIIFSGKKIAGAGTALKAKDEKNLRKRMQVVFQDPLSSLNPRMNVMDIVTEGLLEFKMIKKKERADAARRLMGVVGLDKDAIYRFPHEFSGGQRQRINVARAISLNPKLIICDEAVSALDVSVQAQVINLFSDLREKYGLSYLFISHDLSVVSNIADRIAVMYLGRIVEQGRCEDVIFSPMHPYTRALIDAVPVAGKEKQQKMPLSGDVPSPLSPPPGCTFHPRCPKAMDVCRKTFPDVVSSGVIGEHRVACHLY